MSIVVSGISFHFPNQQELWHPVSFTVPDGGKVAVVGDNGCGKTTLVRLYLCCMLIGSQIILK